MISNLKEIHKQANDNGFSPVPKGVPLEGGHYTKNKYFGNFTKINRDINITVPAAKSDTSNINVGALIQPPNDKYQIHLSESEAETMNDLNSAVTKQLISQFYEVYSQPIGLKDVEYRLGQVKTNISSIHTLLPKGATKVISNDVTASWRVGINYEAEINTGLYTKFGSEIKYRYTSYSFPPFIPKGLNYKTRRQKGFKIPAYYYQLGNNDFDTYNLLYRKDVGTARGLSFKGINDNINTLQFLLNKSSGIESTYMNEWDLSIYMQEGLIRETRVTTKSETLILPEYVTTLTFGLVRDCPIHANEENTNPSSVDIDSITPWASVNCSISTRSALDDVVLPVPANELNYEINSYPLSQFWRPDQQGDNLNYYPYYIKVPSYDENGNSILVDEVRYSDLNVSKYIDDLFAYKDTGLIYVKDDSKVRNSHMKYTPERLHGGHLSVSKVPLEYIIRNSDARDAILSGWNSTDPTGKSYPRENGHWNANAYSHLPFWKQFFFNEEDGLGDLDRYWQELLASGKQENSILDVADDIIGIVTEENEPFNSFKKAKYEEYVLGGANTSDPRTDPFASKYEENEEYGNISIKVFKWRVEIPKTKLLNMFFNRNKVTRKAMKQGDGINSPLDLPVVGQGVNDSKKQYQPNNIDPNKVNGDGTYDMDENEALGATITYADGVNNHSPFLYGGPHGRFYSPNSIEGYCQFQNEVLETVPTMDCSWAYNFKTRSDGPSLTVLNSKNYKCGNYIDSKILLGLSERNAAFNLIQRDTDPEVNIPYVGSYSGKELYTTSGAWEPEFCIGWWWFRHCWRLYVPLRYIFMESRIQNFWPTLGIYQRWNCEYWKNRYFSRTVYSNKKIRLSALVKDFQSDLIMVPSLINDHDWVTNDQIIAAENEDNYLARRNSGVFNGNIYCMGDQPSKYTSTRFVQSKTRYLIAEKNDTIYEWGRYWNAYFKGSSDFDKVKENIYRMAGSSNNLSNPFTVSLPIRKDKNGAVVEIVTGNARIEKSRSVTYVQELRVRWVYESPWYYWWYNSWWGSRWWGWWPFYRHWRRPVYYYIVKPVLMDTYSLYMYPNEVKYIIPTASLIPDPTYVNNQWRNLNSELIVNRWGVNPDWQYTSLSNYWPFNSSFRNSFANTERCFVPGRKYYNTCFDKTLHCKGILFGDIFQNYVDNKNKVMFRGGTGFRYLYNKENVYWNEYKHLFDVGAYLYASFTSNEAKITNVNYRSFYQVAAVNSLKIDNELTRIVRELPSLPALLNVGRNEEPSSKVYYYFNPMDVFDTFIEAATVQQQWLRQMKIYFDKNTNDALIYNTYKDVTDSTIITINKKAAHNQRSSSYYTGSYTEDINYYDALSILEQLFANSAPGKNTISELLNTKIQDFDYIIAAANVLKSRGATWQNLEDFSKFITNVKLYLDGAAGVRDYLIERNWMPDSARNMSYDVYQKTYGEITYDLVHNPTAAIWAYLNVLYQARKFYVNKRMDKKAGSYWIMRSLERVLTFRAAEDKSAMQDNLKLQDDDGVFSSLNMKVDFVQKREMVKNIVRMAPEDPTPTYTKALYVRVKYLGTDDPVNDSNYADGLYKGKEFTLVEVAHKYAYKPADGYYYIMSDSITETINLYIENYKADITNIYNLNETANNAFDVIDKEAFENIRYEPVSLSEWEEAGGETSEYKIGKVVNDCMEKSFDFIHDLSPGIIHIRPENADGEEVNQTELNVVKNKIIDYYNNTLIESINKLLYKVYIKWNPEAIGVGLTESQANQEDHQFIDTYQYELTKKKAVNSKTAFENGTAENNWYDSVFDNAGNEYGLDEAISAGITFGVSDGIEADTMLSNFGDLNSQTIECLSCSLAKKKDYWRVEVPLDSYDIPTVILDRNPVLVSDVAMQELFNRVRGEPTPCGESTLMGIGLKLSPVNDFNKDMLTVSTQAALGMTPSVKSLGIEGLLSTDAEKAFG